jgi:VWFA-related protein
VKKTSVIVFILFVLLCVGRLSGQDIVLEFSVVNGSGEFIPDLKLEDVRVLSGKRPLRLKSIATIEQPLKVLILIDASASQENVLPLEKIAAEKFIDGVLRPAQDSLAIAKFTGELSLVQSVTSDYQFAKETLRRIQFIPPPGYLGGGIVKGTPKLDPDVARLGSSSIWDVISRASDALVSSKPQSTRNIVLLISDGINTFGETRRKDALSAAIRNKTPVFSIGIGDMEYGGIDDGNLKSISQQSGGLAIVPKRKLENLSELLKRMGVAMRKVYKLTLVNDFSKPVNELIETRIEITNPEVAKSKVQIIQPKGYFLPQ